MINSKPAQQQTSKLAREVALGILHLMAQRGPAMCTGGLLLLEERKNKICMYREELCVHEKLHKGSITIIE